MRRKYGSIRNADGIRIQLSKPYKEGENAWYLFGVLDADGIGLAEYWAPTEADLLGEDVSERLITDADGHRGVRSLYVHTNIEDRARLGDVVPSATARPTICPSARAAGCARLGPILPLAEAQELKAQKDAARLQARLAAKAERIAQAAAAAATTTTASTETAAPPSSGKRVAPFELDMDPKRAQQRKDGDLLGFYSKAKPADAVAA